MKNHHTFDWKGFIRRVALIAIPVALQNLLTTTGTMVDTVMIAPLGETTVGAVGLCAQFASLMFSCYWGFVGGSILFFSQYWGALDYRGHQPHLRHDDVFSAFGRRTFLPFRQMLSGHGHEHLHG